jgi:hypothetical protein
MWRHSHCSLWKQDGFEEEAGENQKGSFPREEETAVL